jgi:DNA-binding transcriptional MocR family regulator
MTTEDLNQDLNEDLNKNLNSGSANFEVLDPGRKTDCTKQAARLNSYSEIADDLKKAIESNYYTAGSFPSSRALASRYGVSRSTILAAFGILVRQGLMTVSHGKTPQIINTNFSPCLSPGSQTKQRIAQDPASGLSFAPSPQTHSETNSQTERPTPIQQTEDTPTYEKLSSNVPARKWFALISNQARKAHNQGSMPNLDAILELKLALRKLLCQAKTNKSKSRSDIRFRKYRGRSAGPSKYICH